MLGVLHRVVGRLAALDAASLPAVELGRLVEGLQFEQSRLAVTSAGPLAAWEGRGAWRAGGALSFGLAVGNGVHRCHRAVTAEAARARKLVGMPHTRRAVLEGRLSIDHVDLFCRFATAERWELFVRDEATLVEQCAGLKLFADARTLVRYWAERADDELGVRHTTAPSTLHMSRLDATGEVVIDGHLAPVDGEIVRNELNRLVRELRLEDRAAGIERTPAQRRAAALVRMAERSAGARGVTPRPLFQVILGAETAAHLCELASGAVVRPEDLLPHVGRAIVESFLFDGEHRVLGVSRRRTFTGRLRRAIQVRDRRCQHPSGCPVPATDTDTDIDHVQPYAAGGPTSEANGQVLCIPHNRLAHLHGPPPPEPAPSGAEPTTGMVFLAQWRRRLQWQILHDPDDPLYAATG